MPLLLGLGASRAVFPVQKLCARLAWNGNTESFSSASMSLAFLNPHNNSELKHTQTHRGPDAVITSQGRAACCWNTIAPASPESCPLGRRAVPSSARTWAELLSSSLPAENKVQNLFASQPCVLRPKSVKQCRKPEFILKWTQFSDRRVKCDLGCSAFPAYPSAVSRSPQLF